MRRFVIAILVSLFLVSLMPSPSAHADGAEWVYVVKVMDMNDKVIVQRSTGSMYLLEYGVGCTSLWAMEDRQVLVYSGGYYFADYNSRIIIPDRDQSCRIWDSSRIS